MSAQRRPWKWNYRLWLCLFRLWNCLFRVWRARNRLWRARNRPWKLVYWPWQRLLSLCFCVFRLWSRCSRLWRCRYWPWHCLFRRWKHQHRLKSSRNRACNERIPVGSDRAEPSQTAVCSRVWCYSTCRLVHQSNSTVISTRRFFWRPSSVALSPIGSVSPNHWMIMRSFGTP